MDVFRQVYRFFCGKDYVKASSAVSALLRDFVQVFPSAASYLTDIIRLDTVFLKTEASMLSTMESAMEHFTLLFQGDVTRFVIKQRLQKNIAVYKAYLQNALYCTDDIGTDEWKNIIRKDLGDVRNTNMSYKTQLMFAISRYTEYNQMFLTLSQDVRDIIIPFFTFLYNTVIHSIMLELLTLMKFIEQSTSASIQLLLILEDSSILLIPPKARIELVCIESHPGPGLLDWISSSKAVIWIKKLAVWIYFTGGRLLICTVATIVFCVTFNASAFTWFIACLSVFMVELNLVIRLTDIQKAPKFQHKELLNEEFTMVFFPYPVTYMNLSAYSFLAYVAVTFYVTASGVIIDSFATLQGMYLPSNNCTK